MVVILKLAHVVLFSYKMYQKCNFLRLERKKETTLEFCGPEFGFSDQKLLVAGQNIFFSFMELCILQKLKNF